MGSSSSKKCGRKKSKEIGRSPQKIKRDAKLKKNQRKISIKKYSLSNPEAQKKIKENRYTKCVKPYEEVTYDMDMLSNRSSYRMERMTSSTDFSEKQIESSSFSTPSLQKSTVCIRDKYISKIISKNILENNQNVTVFNSIIIFDWDDTLMCTTYLTPNGEFNRDTEIPEADLEQIAMLDYYAHQILSLAMNKGDCYIVTNACQEWIEYSSQRFFPLVFSIMHKIKVLSARERYHEKFPEDYKLWKLFAFQEICCLYDKSLLTNLICFGDALTDVEAAMFLATKFTNCRLKNVKFKENPTIKVLIKELNLIYEQFHIIFGSFSNLTIFVDKREEENRKSKE
jgi:hypothetical protein